MHPTWQLWLADGKGVLDELENKVLSASQVTPELGLVMKVFESDPESIRVVILGQDPYPTLGAATGMAFAMNSGNKTPKSLLNIAKELADDVGRETVSSASPDLSKWQKQGVFLLNRSLTTEVNKPGAHKSFGWDEFTSLALRELLSRKPVVLILWGAEAISLGRSVSQGIASCVLIESPHPSPLSAYRGFFGSKPFSKANSALIAMGSEQVDWSI
jgi:uracil-DNA glycosylase